MKSNWHIRQKQRTIFSKIYNLNLWESLESVSGPGSTLAYTENLRIDLPNFLKDLEIESILDGPCGDFNWMAKTLDFSKISYLGVDVVPKIILNNKKKYARTGINFRVLDLTTQEIPKADLMLCRDFLFHLSYIDTARFFRNFLRSKIPYLLTSNHINYGDFRNQDIQTGSFKRIDLSAAPYSLDLTNCKRIMDYVTPFPPRELVLITRDIVDRDFIHQF